jgi:RNA recognition motif-containing protein
MASHCGMPKRCGAEAYREEVRGKMKSIFVGNMSFRMTEQELHDLFKPFGEITRVHLAIDRETGRARGFAFVEMRDDADAARAIADLNGKEVHERCLKVNEARPRTSRPRPGLSGTARRPNESYGEDYLNAARQPREPRW